MKADVRVVRSRRPLQLDAVLAAFRRGAGDPTSRTDGAGSWWFAWRVPTGPVTLRLVQRRCDGEVQVAAWGDGAEWMLDHVPDLVGEGDDASGFEPLPHHEALVAAARAFPGWRVARSMLVTQSLIASVIEQKVTGHEAFGGQRRLIRRHGTPAPGPGEGLDLVVPPTPADWARIPSWEWLRAGVDRGRSDTAVRAAGHAGRLEECIDLPLAEAHRRLRAIRGVGRWTAAEVAQRALGDADAVSFGDYHVAKNIGWALTGVEVDDDGLEELLEPYVGHRFRVQRLLELNGAMRPRRGPRMAPRRHLPR